MYEKNQFSSIMGLEVENKTSSIHTTTEVEEKKNEEVKEDLTKFPKKTDHQKWLDIWL